MISILCDSKTFLFPFTSENYKHIPEIRGVLVWLQCQVLPVGGCRELMLGLTSWRKGDLTSWPGDIYGGIELPGVMGGVGFPGRGELGYPGIARPGCERPEVCAGITICGQIIFTVRFS